MGWNSWNRFSGGVSESIVKQVAEAMVLSGMKAAGYQYVIIDDTWQANARDADGNIVADSARFPSGIAALADYVHGLGLSFGLYSDRGTKTCAGRPGSFGYEERDAEAYAAWGVDYLKYDNCYIPSGRENSLAMEEDYRKMRGALEATGRPIVYSICAWWFHDWMPNVGHLWRTTTDIRDGWEDNLLVLLDRNGGYVGRYENAVYGEPGIAHHAGPGGWNDPDMLEVGNGGMSDVEYRSHFSLWAIMAAPLIAGNDVRTMSLATRDILLNTEVIAVDQDPLGRQGVPISGSTALEVWRKPLASGAQAVVLFNRTDTPSDISVTWPSLGISGAARVRDLWLHTDLGSLSDQYTATAVPPHGSVMLTITPE
jgi:alpha-galactosidase